MKMDTVQRDARKNAGGKCVGIGVEKIRRAIVMAFHIDECNKVISNATEKTMEAITWLPDVQIALGE